MKFCLFLLGIFLLIAGPSWGSRVGDSRAKHWYAVIPQGTDTTVLLPTTPSPETHFFGRAYQSQKVASIGDRLGTLDSSGTEIVKRLTEMGHTHADTDGIWKINIQRFKQIQTKDPTAVAGIVPFALDHRENLRMMGALQQKTNFEKMDMRDPVKAEIKKTNYPHFTPTDEIALEAEVEAMMKMDAKHWNPEQRKFYDDAQDQAMAAAKKWGPKKIGMIPVGVHHFHNQHEINYAAKKAQTEVWKISSPNKQVRFALGTGPRSLAGSSLLFLPKIIYALLSRGGSGMKRAVWHK